MWRYTSNLLVIDISERNVTSLFKVEEQHYTLNMKAAVYSKMTIHMSDDTSYSTNKTNSVAFSQQANRHFLAKFSTNFCG
jgi:hypothetical protein